MDFHWLRIASTTLAIISMSLNITVAYFLVFKSAKVPKSYRSLLFGYTIVRFCFGLFYAISCPVILTENGWILATFNMFFNQHAAFAILTLYSMDVVMITVSMTFSYIYRYVHTCRKDYIVWFQMPRYFIIMCSLYAVIGCFITLLYYMVMAGRPNVLVNMLGVNAIPVAYVQIKERDFDGSGKVICTLSIFLCSIIMVLCAFAPILLTYRIRNSLQQHFKTYSPKMRKLQRNLIYMMVTQVVLYLFCWHLPLQVGFLASVVRFSSPWITISIAIFLPFTQVIEPTIIFMFIGNYNNYIMGIFAWNTKVKNVPKSTVQS